MSHTNSFMDRVRLSFQNQGFMHHLGATLTHIEEGECHISVPFAEELTQQHGFFHGGVTATLADNAAGFAAYSLMPADVQPLSVEFKISFVAPARGQRLEARANVLNNGRRLKTAKVEVFAQEGDQDHLVAVALATITYSSSVKEKRRRDD